MSKRRVLISVVMFSLLISQGLSQNTTENYHRVVVEGDRLGSVSDHIGNVQVYSGSDIREMGYDNISDFLSFQSGFSFIADNAGIGNEKTGQLGLRGFSAEKPSVLVVVDGVKINDLNNNRVFWDTLSLNDIEQIEVIKGGSSTIYGSGALAGVINITTKKRKADQIEYAAGGYGLQKVYFNKQLIDSERLGVNISYDNYFEEGFRDGKYGYTGEAITIYTDYQLSSRELIDVKYGSSRTRYGLSGYSASYSDFLYRPDEAQSTAKEDSYYEEGTDNGYLGYTNQINSKLLCKLKYSSRERLQDSDIGYGPYRTWINSDSLVAETVINDILFDQIIIGGELDATLVEAGQLNAAAGDISDSKWDSSAVFAEINSSVGRMDYSLGYREDNILVDYQDIYDSAFGKQNGRLKFVGFSPRAAVNYHLNERLNLYSSWSTSFKAPPLEDFATVVPPYESNTNIQPQTAEQLEAGIVNQISGGASIELSGYRTIVADEIFQDPSTYTNENVDTIHQGGEFIYKTNHGEKDIIVMNYALQNAFFNEKTAIFEKNKVIPLIPEYKWTISYIKSLSDIDKLTLSGIYVGPYYAQNNVENLERKEAPYGLLDIGYSRRQNDDLNVRIDVENVFNEKYSAYTSADYSGFPASFSGKFFYTPAPGRTAKVTVRYLL